MAALSSRILARLSNPNQGSYAAVDPLRDAIVGDVRPAMRVLLGAVGLVFLIACANVASLVLGAALGRTHDFAMRTALGAGRGRLIRGVFVEMLLLSVAGALVGVAAAAGAMRAIASLQTAGIPLLDETRVDLSALAFAAVAATAAAALVGIIPALHASRAGVVAPLRTGSTRTTGDRHRARTRSIFVAAEIAVAVALLIGAALLGRSFLTLVRVDLGLQLDRVQTFSISLPDERYKAPERRASFIQDLTAAICVAARRRGRWRGVRCAADWFHVLHLRVRTRRPPGHLRRQTRCGSASRDHAGILPRDGHARPSRPRPRIVRRGWCAGCRRPQRTGGEDVVAVR